MTCFLLLAYVCIVMYFLSRSGHGESREPTTEPTTASVPHVSSWYSPYLPRRPTAPPTSQPPYLATWYMPYLSNTYTAAGMRTGSGTDDHEADRAASLKDEEAVDASEGTLTENAKDDTDVVLILHGPSAKLVRLIHRALARLLRRTRRAIEAALGWATSLLLHEFWFVTENLNAAAI